MRKFLDGYSADFIGLTGPPKTVKRLAAQFRAPFYKGNEAGSRNGYTVAHSQQAFVVDMQGALRAELYNASTEAMAGIAAALVDESGTPDHAGAVN